MIPFDARFGNLGTVLQTTTLHVDLHMDRVAFAHFAPSDCGQRSQVRKGGPQPC